MAWLQNLVSPSLSWTVLRIPLLHSTPTCLTPLVPSSAPVGAEAWRSYQDGGLIGLEGAEERAQGEAHVSHGVVGPNHPSGIT